MNDYIVQFRSKITFYWLSAHFSDLGRFSAQVVSVARRDGDSVVQAAATLGIARHLRATGRFRLARAAADSSLQQSQSLGNPLLTADALIERARILMEGYFDPLEARTDLDQALALSLSAGYVEGEALACVGMARAWLMREQPLIALHWADRAEALARKHMDNLALAEAGLVRGLTLITLERRREAHSTLTDALALCKRLDYNVYRPLISIAMVLNHEATFDLTHVSILETYATDAEWRDHFAVRWAAREGIVQIYAHLIEDYERLAQALAAADHLHKLSLEAQHPPLALIYGRWMGYLLATCGRYASAQSHTREVIALARQYANPYQEMKGWAALGAASLQEQPEQACHAFQQARTLAFSLGDTHQANAVLLPMLLSGLRWQIQRVLAWLGWGRS